jgi:hypothetical protein
MKYKVTLSSETDINNQEWIYVRLFDENGDCKESKPFYASEISKAQETYDAWVEFLTINNDMWKKVQLKSTIIE